MKKSRVNERLLRQLLTGEVDKKYFGKQVVFMGGQMQMLPEDDREAVALVEKLEKKYPEELPHLVTVPRPETYILVVCK